MKSKDKKTNAQDYLSDKKREEEDAKKPKPWVGWQIPEMVI